MDYEGVGDVLDALDQEPTAGANDHSVTVDADNSWDLGIGWDGAMDAYTGGWSEGAKKAYDLAERIKPRPLENRTHLVSNVAGGVPNVGAYLAGAPNAMYQVSKKQAKGRPYVHLYMPISYSATIDANVAFDRGCALVAVADALESAGCRVKITLTRTSALSYSHRVCMRFMVKNYGDRLDVDQLIFTAAHPAMLRRLCFGLQERSRVSQVWKQTTSNYGVPTDLVQSEDCEVDGRAITVLFPRLQENKGTPEEFLKQMVRALPEEIQTEIEGG